MIGYAVMIGALLDVLYLHPGLSEILLDFFKLSSEEGVFMLYFRRFLELRLKSAPQIQNLSVFDFCLT